MCEISLGFQPLYHRFPRTRTSASAFFLHSKYLFSLMSIGEQACSLAALILYDDGIPITAEKISTLLKSANISVESFWATLIAKLLEKKNVDDLILNVGSGSIHYFVMRCGGASVAAAAPAAGGGGGAVQDAAPAVEEKKEEPKEESDEDMGFSLFD
ncbi:60S acidic ribosomal protein P1-like [Phalaenopsis equestris]|uniref:60S acidic ribosomal protein P1-like n=1 Tax=Phalaenopsis equestris TaxID=78828 RepID=UPI0009E5EB80|nr:60S acidic ribosomal protein P1-like [Phalaenopsis equestris]